MRRQSFPVLLFAASFTGCMVGPDYKRPDIPAPPQYRAGEAQPAAQSFGEAKWFDVFQDETLRGLIKEAIAANYDIRIAAQRVLDAEGRLAATRSGLFPQFGASGGASRTGTNSPVTSAAGGFGVASWEIDLFGKIRRASEAARADLLATRENQSAVMQTLVSEVALAYFDLREYDTEMEYVRESLKTRTDSLRLVAARQKGGVATMLEVDQAQSLVASAQANLAALERAAEQTENLINFLLAKPPGPVARGRALTEQPQPPAVPAGLPSALIDRRPDLRIAEQQLVAANARIGVAKAAFFPSITLTGAGGYQSVDLLGVIGRTGFGYSMAGAVDLPLFDAGRRSGNYKSAQAQHQILLINYQRAINGAFREVSDSLIGHQKAKEFRASQELFASTLRDQSRLSNLRYRGGVTSYLEVLDTERQRLAGEQALAQAQRDELASLVLLYKALGGGWQQ
jgi:multidrug efflux system outer membrane protein